MKKILLLTMLTIFSIGAKAAGCNYVPPTVQSFTNNTDCDIVVQFVCFTRTNPCNSMSGPYTLAGTPPTPTVWSPPTIIAHAHTSTALVDSTFCGDPCTTVLMAQFGWSNQNCATATTVLVQFEGPNTGSGQFYSCGPYIMAGSGVTVNMPTCATCGSAHVEWNAGGGLEVNP